MTPSSSDPGREPAPTTPGGVAGAVAPPRPLSRLRWGQWFVAAGFAGVFPAQWLGSKLGVPAELLAVGVAVLGMLRTLTFVCPRCGWLFVFSWRWQNVFASACVHCGYPRPAQPDGPTRQPGGSR